MRVTTFSGGRSDIDAMKGVANCLGGFRVGFKTYVLSTHRVPEKLTGTLKKAEESGCEVIIAGTGLIAHLPGVIASQTAMPIIGAPIRGAVEGLDALFLIVQMLKSIPAATVGINNSYNVEMLAVQTLAVKDGSLREKLNKFRLGVKGKSVGENGDEVEF